MSCNIIITIQLKYSNTKDDTGIQVCKVPIYMIRYKTINSNYLILIYDKTLLFHNKLKFDVKYFVSLLQYMKYLFTSVQSTNV